MYNLPQRQVHLDFHTGECIEGVGSAFDKEQFKSCLKKGHVNSITVFAKCHHGWSYFPSETTPMHPGLNGFDLLGEMLKACSEAGVAAPIYLSAGWDERYFYLHPEHAVIEKRGDRTPLIYENCGHKFASDGPRWHTMCVNSPYLDFLESQVREVVERYDPPAVFMDIVSPERFRCYCPRCRSRVISLGLDESDDSSYAKLGEILYREYTERINAAAQSVNPNTRVFHNAGHIAVGRRDLAFMDTHLELESLPTGGWGYDHFPKSVRYASTLGMEYLGMTGKFHASWGDFGGFKHPNALRYEVALSLANGAKCSIGDQMHPYGFLDDATYELIGVAYAEAEAVEEYCYDIETVADVAILSAEALGILTEHRGNPCDTGANRIMLEGKYLYDIIDTESDFGKYKLIILPDLIKIDERIEGKLKAFVRGGGKLLCSGVSGTGADGGFVFDLGCEFAGASGFMPSYIAPDYEALGLSKTSYVVRSKLYNTRKTDGEILAYSRNSFFNRTREHFCSHRHTPYECVNNAPGITVGKDGAYIAWDIFTEYAKVGSYVVKEAVIKVVDKLLGEKKTLKTNLPSGGVVTLNRQREHDREVLHALYAAPVVRGTDTQIIEDLIPISNTEFEIKTDREVRAVTLVPENTELDFRYECGAVKFTVPTFTCKQVVVIKF